MKIGGMYDGQICFCMTHKDGVILEKVIKASPKKEGIPELEFVPTGKEPFTVFKLYTLNLSPILEGGEERFVRTIRGMNPQLNLPNSSIVVRVAKYVKHKNKEQVSLLS